MIAEQRKASVRQRIRPYMAPVLFLGADYAAILAAGSLSNILYGLPVAKSCLYLWFPLILLISLIQSKAYANMQPIIYTVRSVFYAITFAVAACIAALYFFYRLAGAALVFRCVLAPAAGHNLHGTADPQSLAEARPPSL